MKNISAPLLLALALSALTLTACTDPIAAYQDPIVEYPQVHLETYYLQDQVRVQKPIVSRVGAGQLKVSVEIRSKHDADLPLEYYYYFSDAAGKQIYASGRQSITIPRKGINTIQFVSLEPAADFRVELRIAQNYP